MKHVIFAVMLMSAAVAQVAPPTAHSQQLPTGVLQRDETEIVTGRVVAYDWSTRFYMEGARVERFIFEPEPSTKDSRARRLMRVVLLWHPADKPRVIPKDFYAADKRWRLTLRTTSFFDFVRQYCETDDAPTFTTQVDNGKTVKLPRYVKPAALPPDADLATNFRTALAEHPQPPEMPDPRSLRCLYVADIAPVDPNQR